jgi:hypothetical protein
MIELGRLIEQRKCHFELSYSSVTDYMMKLFLRKYNRDGSDFVVYEGQSNDLDYLISKCEVAYKDWLLKNEGGY